MEFIIGMSFLGFMLVIIFCICLVTNKDFPDTKMGQCMVWIMAIVGLLILASVFCG